MYSQSHKMPSRRCPLHRVMVPVQPLAPGDGSSGDPASIGVAVLLANWTNLGGEDYAGAATAQIEYLFGPSVPKTQDGAISHRVTDLQLWYAVR
jgi:hypothetical protein